jgi:flotillin
VPAEQLLVLVGVAVAAAVVAAAWFVHAHLHRVADDEALVVNGAGETRVRFAPTLVWPIVQRAERMKLGAVAVPMARSGIDAISCADGTMVDFSLTLTVRIPKDEAAVRALAAQIGCARACDPSTVQTLFHARLFEITKTVLQARTFEELDGKERALADNIRLQFGEHHNGYAVEGVVVHALAPTPPECIDGNTILGAAALAAWRRRTGAPAR